jgi:hypothetical protein
VRSSREVQVLNLGVIEGELTSDEIDLLKIYPNTSEVRQMNT